MVDYAQQMGIDLEALMFEDFSHPVARYENDKIHAQGVEFWKWYRDTHPEAPPESDEPVAKGPRVRKYSFTDKEMAAAMRSVRESR